MATAIAESIWLFPLLEGVFFPKMPQWAAGRTPAGARFCAVLSLIVSTPWWR